MVILEALQSWEAVELGLCYVHNPHMQVKQEVFEDGNWISKDQS